MQGELKKLKEEEPSIIQVIIQTIIQASIIQKEKVLSLHISGACFRPAPSHRDERVK